jgi:hypothetical protein
VGFCECPGCWKRVGDGCGVGNGEETVEEAADEEEEVLGWGGGRWVRGVLEGCEEGCLGFVRWDLSLKSI